MPRKTQGCGYEVLNKETGDVLVKRFNNWACFSTSNVFLEHNRQEIILNIFENKENIDFSVEEIQRYLELIKEIGLFADIEFIPDFTENEYKFVVKTDPEIVLSKYKGTYTVIRYLWGDGDYCKFDRVVKSFLPLVEKYPKEDKYMLLQIAHMDLPDSFNSNHCLLTSITKIMKGKQVKFHSHSMNTTYSGNDYMGEEDSISLLTEECRKLLGNLDLEGILKNLKRKDE